MAISKATTKNAIVFYCRALAFNTLSQKSDELAVKACVSQQWQGYVMSAEPVFQPGFVRCQSLLETYVHSAASAWEMSINIPFPCPYRVRTGLQ